MSAAAPPDDTLPTASWRARASDGNQVTLLQSGGAFFPSLLAAIDAALSEVWLETYIFADDATGLRVAGALARAAERGVAVRVLVDGYGTRTLASGIAQRMAGAGVEVRVYAPVRRLLTLDRERLRRLHRKQACIDARVAFVGGINVLDDLWDPNHGALDHPRLDYAVRLHGPVAAAVHVAMGRLWRQVSMMPLALFDGLPGRARQATRGVHGGVPPLAAGAAGAAGAPGTGGEPGVAGEPGAGGERRLAGARARQLEDAGPPAVGAGSVGVRAALVLRDNLVHRRAIERAYLKAIGGARREVLIATAYFFPGRRFRRALREAARRGVRVRLLLQGRSEYLLPHLAARSMYAGLLEGGVEIVEYHRSFLHAKVAVIDDWATVGSSNIDPFSLLLALEANVMVADAGFAATLRESLLASMTEGGREVLPADTARRSWTQRLYGWFAWRMLRLGVVISGSRDRY
jgi:cardiolipin synthase